MKFVFEISEYSYEIHIEGKKIQYIDQTSQQIIYSKSLRKPIKEVKKEQYDRYKLIHSKVHQYNLIVGPNPKFKSEIITKSNYILDLHLKSPTHGYFFGLYQIGEFILTKRNKLVLRKAFPIKFCNKGWVTPSNEVYLSLRESETLNGPHSYFFVKLNWKKKPKPSLVWKKQVKNAIISINQISNILFLGMKDGSLQRWDIKNDKWLKGIDLFKSPISVLEQNNDKIIAATRSGDIATLQEDGHITWRVKTGKEQINGVFEDNKGIHVVNYRGMYYQIDSTTGKIITQKNWNIDSFPDKSTLSNMIVARNWIIISSGGNFAGYWKDNNIETFRKNRGNQPLVQQLATHPKGFYSGDDYGRIIFWELPLISIKKEKIKVN